VGKRGSQREELTVFSRAFWFLPLLNEVMDNTQMNYARKFTGAWMPLLGRKADGVQINDM
jgi:hypothetical protein